MLQAENDVTETLSNGGLMVNAACVPSDLAEDIDAKLAQLDAVLLMTHGNAGDSFRALRDDLQDNYLWSVRESLAQITAIWKRYSDVMAKETFANGVRNG